MGGGTREETRDQRLPSFLSSHRSPPAFYFSIIAIIFYWDTQRESNEALIPYPMYCRPFHFHYLFPREEREGGGGGRGGRSSTQALDPE